MKLNFLDNYKDTFTDMDPLYDIDTYKDPSWVDNDFFDYDPTKTDDIEWSGGGVDWSDIYADPTVLKGTDNNSNLLGKGLEFLGKFAGDSYSDQTSQYYDKLKTQSGLPTDKPSNSWYSQVPGTNVGFYGGGNNSVANLASSYPQIASSPVNFRPAGSALGISDIARMGSGVVQSKLTDMALGAVPGIGPALVIANKVYPGGITEAAKDASKLASDVVGGVARFAGDALETVESWMPWNWCDERLKVDIAPLESTEVNDELAQVAFFVKGLHECS